MHMPTTLVAALLLLLKGHILPQSLEESIPMEDLLSAF